MFDKDISNASSYINKCQNGLIKSDYIYISICTETFHMCFDTTIKIYVEVRNARTFILLTEMGLHTRFAPS